MRLGFPPGAELGGSVGSTCLLGRLNFRRVGRLQPISVRGVPEFWLLGRYREILANFFGFFLVANLSVCGWPADHATAYHFGIYFLVFNALRGAMARAGPQPGGGPGQPI